MKKLIIVLISLMGIVSCTTTTTPNTDVQTRYSTWGCILKVVDIDSCEYLVAQTGTSDGGVAITHKQNCKYCSIRNK